MLPAVFAQGGGEARVFFHEDEPSTASKEVFGDGAQTGADFDDGVLGTGLQRVGHPSGQIIILQEILALGAAGAHIEA